MRIAKVGVLIDAQTARKRRQYGINVFAEYIKEIFSHAGIPFRELTDIHQLTDVACDVLIAAVTSDDKSTADKISEFARQGGTVIAYGELGKLASRLGCKQSPSFVEGYAYLSQEFGELPPLRFFQAHPWMADPQSELLSSSQLNEVGYVVPGTPKGEKIHPCLQRFTIGQGTVERWSVDIPTTVVGFQQGLNPVLADGVPAPDGTAQIDEGILKADDGIQLNWELDRVATPTGQQYFPHPYADLWRAVCISHLLKVVTSKGLTLPFVGYWPDGVKNVAMISHDSDGNLDEFAESTLRILKELDIRSTWCMLEPGYSPDVYTKVIGEGHEIAFHYNAFEIDGGKWGEEAFVSQLNWLKRASGLQEITSNKNHYTRFEGFGELFEWCERHKISVDQTRGPSKGGNIGFLFGTCHPYFPIAWWNEQNRLYNVLEIGFLTQDLDLGGQWADSSIIKPFLEQVQRVDGVAHFLFHQVHLHRNPQVVAAIKRVVSEARKLGFTFWTSKQINEWEQARREVKIAGVTEQGNIVLNQEVQLSGVDNAVIWIPLVNSEQSNRFNDEQIEMRFGVPCVKQVISHR